MSDIFISVLGYSMSLVKSQLYWLVFFCGIVITVSSNAALASESGEQPLKIPAINGEVIIDGNLSEAQWKNATKILVNNITRPYDNIPSPVHTEALIMSDADTFYIAFIANDPEPNQITAFYKDRDKAWGNDLVGIKIDTFNDQRTAYRFLVNPLGAQIDGIESEVTRKQSDAWDGIWQSAGQINSKGYIVEMALPFRMLNFTEKDIAQDWGMEFLRFYPRDERLRLSNITLDRGNTCELCQLHTVLGFVGAKQGNNFTITPALVSSVNQERDDNQDWQDTNSNEASLDLRWGITPDILLNATINPDFSTVETDDAQLNVNNNFALFFQEKRPFFLDNADYFDSDYNLIYTRNINSPNYGAKLTGRKDDHSFGLFMTDDSSTNILIPGNRGSSVAEISGESKASAFRYRYNYNKDVTLGWISTLRTAANYENSVHGVDARIRVSTSDVVKFQTLISSTQYPDDLYQQFCDADDTSECQSPETTDCQFSDCIYSEQVLRTLSDDTFSGNAFKAAYYHNDKDWSYRVTYNRQNSGFRGDLGFISVIDQNKLNIGAERKWYAQPNNWWSKIRLFSDWDITRNDNNVLIEEEYEINAQIEAKYSSELRFNYTLRDKVGSRLDKSSLAIKNNTTLFNENQWSISGQIKPLLGLSLNSKLEMGDGIDYNNNRLGKIKHFNASVNWNINKHLELKINQRFNQLNVHKSNSINDQKNDNVFIARLTDFRLSYQFDTTSFLRFSVIYNNTSRNPLNYLYQPEEVTAQSKNLGTELLYAYKINPQTVFYLGYSDQHSTEENINELAQSQRRIFMKFSYAWMQ